MRKIVKRERQKERNKAMKNNSIFQKNEGNVYTEKNEGSKYKGQVTTMNKFVKFWAGILEDESETTNKKWTENIKESIKEKIRK